MLQYLFDTKGRIGRSGWWLRVFFILPFLSVFYISIVTIALSFVQHDENLPIAIFSMILIPVGLVLLIWIYISASIRRHHDQGKSGWHMLWVFIPAIGSIIDLFISGFVAGEPGSNKYGPSPKRSGAQTKSDPKGNWGDDIDIERFMDRQTQFKPQQAVNTTQSADKRTPPKSQTSKVTRKQFKERSAASQTPLVSRHSGLKGRIFGKKR